MSYLSCIIMVTMSLMIIPSFGTDFRLSPVEGSIKQTKKAKITSFLNVKKLFDAEGKKKKWDKDKMPYPTFKDITMLYQAQNVMSLAMYIVGKKEGRPFGMYLDPSKSEQLEAFRIEISEPFSKKNKKNPDSKKNPGRVAEKYQYKKGNPGQVALYINIPKVIADKKQISGDKEIKIEPGWIWMWVPQKMDLNKLFGTKKWNRQPWIFVLRSTEFPASKKSATAAHARIHLADNMGYYDDAYNDLYDDDDIYYNDMYSEENYNEKELYKEFDRAYHKASVANKRLMVVSNMVNKYNKKQRSLKQLLH